MCILDREKDNFTITVLLDTIDKAQNFVTNVSHLDCKVTVEDGDYVVNGKSILGIFSLNLFHKLNVYVPQTHSNDLIKLINEWIVK